MNKRRSAALALRPLLVRALALCPYALALPHLLSPLHPCALFLILFARGGTVPTPFRRLRPGLPP